jgi:hypothetical protein
VTSSNQFFDMTGSGYQNRTAWAGPGNGVLVLDLSGVGNINNPRDFEFTRWDPTAKTDMQALKDVFDTNHNGKLDPGDAAWSQFGVLVTNANGTTQFETLSALGITSINLTTDNNVQVLPDGTKISGETTYTTSTGSGTAADVSLAFDPAGYTTQQTTTLNGDGSTTIDVKALNPDGSLANETLSTTSADGLTVTIQYDDGGTGVIDRKQIDVTVISGGTRTVTVSNYDATGGIRPRSQYEAVERRRLDEPRDRVRRRRSSRARCRKRYRGRQGACRCVGRIVVPVQRSRGAHNPNSGAHL